MTKTCLTSSWDGLGTPSTRSLTPSVPSRILDPSSTTPKPYSLASLCLSSNQGSLAMSLSVPIAHGSFTPRMKPSLLWLSADPAKLAPMSSPSSPSSSLPCLPQDKHQPGGCGCHLEHPALRSLSAGSLSFCCYWPRAS